MMRLFQHCVDHDGVLWLGYLAWSMIASLLIAVVMNIFDRCGFLCLSSESYLVLT